MTTCEECSTENPQSARFCFQCGAALAAACPECGAALPVPDARFCPSCGARLAAEVEDEHMLKPVSILFADVVSSTSRAEQMYPEDIRALMADFFGAMTKEIRGEGGRIEKFIGDAVMAVFGVPTAHEDDPLRAVRAAKRMLARLQEWNTTREPLHQIQLRIGVNTGDVLAAAPGSDLMVTGDAVNVAARFEQSAPHGGIVVGERTARVVRAYFVLGPLEPLTLKGKAEPVPAYLVGEPKEIVQARGVQGSSAPLVGRDEEIAALVARLNEAENKKTAQLVNVVAPAGVGKSRLVSEFMAAVGTRAKIVIGRCLPYGEGVTLWPLGEILRAESGGLLTDPPEVALEKIVKLVRHLIPENMTPDRERTVGALASTIGLADTLDPLGNLDPRERFRELLFAWQALFEAMAQDSPLVVVVDDIHSADPTMLEVLDHMTAHITAPVLFVCPTRPDLFDSHSEWRKHPVLELSPLSEEHSEALVEQLLGRAELPARFKELVLTKSEGNPFFIEEIIERLIDEGHLVNEGGTWSVSDTISEVEIPDTVQGVILARIDLLPPTAKRVIQNAAVMGRVFWAGAIPEVANVQEVLDDLEQREFIFRNLTSAMAGEAEYRFKHILIRDVAYETLPRKKRATGHAEAAAWIEKINEERIDELAELLGHHYHQAFTYSKDDTFRRQARRHYETAAHHAISRFAVQQAEVYGWLVVDLSTEGAERIQGLESLGDLYCMSLGMDGAWKVYRDALNEIRETNQGDADAVGRIAAKAAIVPTRYEAAMRKRPTTDDLNEVISLGFQAVPDSETNERVLLLASKAMMQVFGYEEINEFGDDCVRSAVEIAERIGDPDLISCALDAITYWLSVDGLYGQINAVNRRRIELIPQLHKVSEICDVYIVGTWSSLFVGRYRDAVASATSCLERARGVEPGSYFLGLVDRVHARFMTGDWDGALRDQREVEDLADEDESGLPPPHASSAYAFSLFLSQLRGESERAAHCESILKGFDTSRPTVRGATWARALAHRDEATLARQLLNLERSPVRCCHLEALCDVVASQEDWDSAPEAVAMARDEASRAELLALPWFADRLEGQLHAALEQWEMAEAMLARSTRGFRRLYAPWESAFSRLHLAQVLLKAGRRDEARSEAAMSLKVFARLGSVSERERAAKMAAL